MKYAKLEIIEDGKVISSIPNCEVNCDMEAKKAVAIKDEQTLAELNITNPLDIENEPLRIIGANQAWLLYNL